MRTFAPACMTVTANLTLDEVKATLESGGALFAIHYASESFFEAQSAPMAISAIAVQDVRAQTTTSFARVDVESDDEGERERAILDGFYAFLSANRDATFLHWNMGGVEFGLEAIAKRYRYLGGDPSVVAPSAMANVDKLIRTRYGEDYAPHRRFESIARLNDLDLRGFMSGADEAAAFATSKWGDIARSSATKAKLIARLLQLLASGSLRTNSSAGRLEFGGETLDAAAVVVAIGEKWARIQRALRDRPQTREPLSFVDEYDDQYLLRGLLALFFEDVRPEDYVPEYAGGRSRVDFLLPDHGLAIELKHTRTGLTDRKLGEELVIDSARYIGAKNASHLIALVFDPTRELSNPVGLERDLQRDVGSAELAITVRIFS
jgi:hypothetical protein